jgi:tripartite-type tricarboxylate transporter receptor subunit TctC
MLDSPCIGAAVMNHRSISCVLCALMTPALASAQVTAPKAAQAYPSKPVRFLVPFAPGGGNDVMARIIGQKLTEAWGQTFVVDNRPGAGGNVAAEITARSAPDGYTVFQFNVANAIAVSLYKQLNYDPIKDFTAVTQLGSTQFMLVVHPSVSAKTVQELITVAKSQPGKLNYGSSGNGGSSHLVTELFKTKAGIDLVHIPFNGAAPALSGLLAAQVEVQFAPMATNTHVAAGRLRALGVSSLKRSALAPDVPTVAESGIAGFDGTAWYGVVVPAGTPAVIVAKLHSDMVKILQQPELRSRMAAQGLDLVGTSPVEFAQFIKSEIAKWGPIVKFSGAKVD